VLLTLADAAGAAEDKAVTVRRFTKGDWAQVKLVGEKVVASSWNGEEIKEKYRLIGRSVVRVVTSDSTYDYQIDLDVEAEDIPF
jgi:hypothetical protein